jgi:hypothetical protein
MKKSRPIREHQHMKKAERKQTVPTYDEAFHLIFSNDIHMQDLLHFVVKFVGASSRCHDA